MKILITGGCGFVGANLISHLYERNWGVVRVLDNESLGRRNWIEGFDVEFIPGDIRDFNSIATALDGVEGVVHLAADTRVMDSINDPGHNFDVNVQGTFNVLEAMREKGVRRIVNASSGGAIIGEATPPVHEQMLPRPSSPYGAGKLSNEGYLSAYAQSFGLSAMSLRFSNVYGRRSYHKGSVVATFLKRIAQGQPIMVYGDGSQTRDYVFAEDLCEGIVQAMDANCSGVFQLGTGFGTSINELIQVIRNVVEPEFPINVIYDEFRSGEVRHTWCDISKAAAAFSYAPKTSLHSGIKQTWEWFISTGIRK